MKQFTKASEQESKQMKCKGFIFLKRNSNYTDMQIESLRNLMNYNMTIYKACLLKEQLIYVYEEEDYETASKRLDEKRTVIQYAFFLEGSKDYLTVAIGFGITSVCKPGRYVTPCFPAEVHSVI